ncbi:hypothetical protein KW784_01395 [Candidatus Parcubacteria bacterium]|nr:hypothetical protein [Candidatus Parcubacteria bacterium]
MVELIVSLAIMGVIFTVILLNQSSYNEAAGLTALADDVAARVSESQAYGIAVKELSPGSSDFSASYGVSISTIASGANLVYLVFADRNANGIYDGLRACATGGANECLERTDITRGNYVDSLCIIKNNGTDDCSAPKRADITFVRPDPSAHITVFNSSGSTYTPGNMAGVRYVFKSPSGLSRSVSVYFNGQVSVQ